MLFLLILALCYSVSSFDLDRTRNDKDGNIVKGLLDGQFKKIHKYGEEIVENLAKFEKNPLADLGFGRITDPSKTKRDAVPNSASLDDLSKGEQHRFCQRIDLECCCSNCGEADCDSDLPESFDWSQHLTMPARRPSNSSADLVARIIADFVQLHYERVYKEVAPTLAAQQLTDCAEGWETFFQWVGAVIRLNIQGGFELESEYEADTSDSKCRFKEYKKAVLVDTCLQLNIEDENCLKRIVYENGPLLVGLRKANWAYNKHQIESDCDAVRDEYTPFILVGYYDEDSKSQGIWWLLTQDGQDVFGIPRGIACQDIGMYSIAIPIMGRH